MIFDKTTRSILLLALAFFGAAFLSAFWPLQLLLIWQGFCFLWVAVAFLRDDTGAFGKQSDGQLTRVSRFFLWPYHVFNWLSMALFRRFSRGNIYDEIAPNLFVGARLNEQEARRLAPRIRCVIDLCAELPENKALQEAHFYFSFPTLDTRAPDDLAALTSVIQEARKEGAVYIHCAAGRGRSAMVICAVLLDSSEAKTVEDAREIVRRKRPMEFHRAQELALQELEGV